MALGSTQPLVKMSTRNIPGDKGGRCVRLTTYHHTVPLSRNLGALISKNPLGLFRPVTGVLFLHRGNCMIKYYTIQSYQQANNMIHSVSRRTELRVFELKLLKHILEKKLFSWKNTSILQQESHEWPFEAAPYHHNSVKRTSIQSLQT